MGWVDDYRGQTIGVDTAPLIYFIEANAEYLRVVEPFFEAVDQSEILAVTSTVTLLEVLVQPLRQNEVALVNRYREILLNANNLVMMDLVPEIAEDAAQLRAKYNLRTPDSIQIATTLYMGATTLITNDRNLRKVTEIQAVILDELR